MLKVSISNEPSLFRFAVPRIGGDAIPGYYCDDECMWVVESRDGVVPLVDFDFSLREITTKTRTKTESDDQAVSSFLTIVTKTLTVTETDDDDWHDRKLFEIATKTSVQLESDDQKICAGNMM